MCSVKKKVFWKTLPIHRKTAMLESLFNKVTGLQACIFIKRDFNTGVFLWTLWNFQERLFWSTSANDFFCISEIQNANDAIYIPGENFILNFRIYKIFSYLLSFANFSSVEFVFDFAFFWHTLFPTFLTTFPLFFSNLSRLNAFSHYQKFVLMGNSQDLNSGFI